MSLKGSDQSEWDVQRELSLLSPTEWNFLKIIHDEKISEIKPRITDYGFSYRHIIEGRGLDISDEELNSIFKKYSEVGIFKEKYYDSIIICPECNSALFDIRYHCEACGSTNISYGEAFEHLTCGYVDFIKSFAEKDYICPKCGKRLRAIGVDYRKVGRVYRCTECGFTSTSIETRIYCARCGSRVDENPKTLHGYSYVVSEEKLRKFLESKNIVMQVEDSLNRLALTYKMNHTIKGESGMSHVWPFALWIENPPSASPDLTIEILPVSNMEELTSMIMKTAIKKADTSVSNALLLTQVKPDKTTCKVGDSLNIEIKYVQNAQEIFNHISETVQRLKGSQQ